MLLGTFTVAISESHQALVVDPVALTIPEGGQSAFSVKLAEAPPANVTVTIVPVSGDTNVITTAAIPIVFTPLTWNIAAPVVVNALVDNDRIDAIATFEIRSDGLPTVSVFATQTDTTPDPNETPLTFESINDSAGAIGMSANAVIGVSYTLQTSADFLNWTDVETKTAISTTVDFARTDSGERARFYRIKR